MTPSRRRCSTPSWTLSDLLIYPDGSLEHRIGLLTLLADRLEQLRAELPRGLRKRHEMTNWTLLFIGACWVVWLLYWLLMAFRTKRTIERGGLIGYRLVALVIVGACLLAGGLVGVSPHSRVWHTALALGVVSDCIVLAGVAFTVWARITLGRNWSAEVTFKHDHELIESGPYALARHPIYTGLFAMALGTAINYGRFIGFALLLALCGAIWWKARDEERIMSRHFPGAYAGYRERVRAIIPFVL